MRLLQLVSGELTPPDVLYPMISEGVMILEEGKVQGCVPALNEQGARAKAQAPKVGGYGDTVVPRPTHAGLRNPKTD